MHNLMRHRIWHVGEKKESVYKNDKNSNKLEKKKNIHMHILHVAQVPAPCRRRRDDTASSGAALNHVTCMTRSVAWSVAVTMTDPR